MVAAPIKSQPPQPSLKPIPQPEPLNLLRWTMQPLEYLEEGAQKYGELFTVKTTHFEHPIVIISHPQALKDLFTTPADAFDVGKVNTLVEPFMGKHSLFLLDGEPHRRHRRLLMPPFHGEQMRAYGDTICEIARQASGTWKINRSFDIYPSMKEISFQVILQVVFGLGAGQHEDLQRLIMSYFDTMTSPLGTALMFFLPLRKDWGPWSPWGRLIRQRKHLEAMLTQEIEQRRQNLGDRKDILSLLLMTKDETGAPLSNQEVFDELLTLLLAGNDTLTTALSWAFYWIHRDPEVQEKLLTELATLGENPDPVAISQLPYLTAVCSEALRFYPPLFITFRRIVKKPITIMGYQIEPGTQILPSIYLAHHRPETYPDPEQFKPERFLERQFTPYEFLPFGGGHRRCIGQAFAEYEMKLVLATILSQYSLKLASNRPIRMQRHGFASAPAGGVRMIVTDKLEYHPRQGQATATPAPQPTSGCPFKRYFSAAGRVSHGSK